MTNTEQVPRPSLPHGLPRGLLLGSVLSLFAGCATPVGPRPLLVGGGPSVLPNLGLSGSVALRVHDGPRHETWLEAELTQQFLDDADLADVGNPKAGDWTQLCAGVKFALPSTERRDWTVRTGLAWVEARGSPNILDDPGQYYGVYLGVGFETRITEHLTIGPELAMLSLYEDGGGDLHLVPQATWRILWRF